MTAGDNGEATPSPQNGNNAPRYTVPDAAVSLPKHNRLLRTARSGAILSALMLPAVLLSPPAGYGVIDNGSKDRQAAPQMHPRHPPR